MEKKKSWFERHEFLIATCIVMFTILSVVSYLFYGAYVDATNDEHITVTGKIIDVEYIGESDYYLDGDELKIIFEDGSSYVIDTYESFDFTVNSEFIIKLFKDDPDGNWVIERYYKVPD